MDGSDNHIHSTEYFVLGRYLPTYFYSVIVSIPKAGVTSITSRFWLEIGRSTSSFKVASRARQIN